MRFTSSIAALSFVCLVAGQSSSLSSAPSSSASASASGSSSISNLVSASSTPTSSGSSPQASVTGITDSSNCAPCANISMTFTNCNVESNLNTTCLCSESIQQTYLQCVECVLQYTGASNATVGSYQALMDGYRNQCASATVSPTSLPAVTVTLPQSGSSSSSSSPGASSNASTTSTVVSTTVSSSVVSMTSTSTVVASSQAASPSASSSPSGGAERATARTLTLLAGGATLAVCLAAAVGI